MDGDTFVRINLRHLNAIRRELEALDHICTAMKGVQGSSYSDAAYINVLNVQGRIREVQRLLPGEDEDMPF